MAYAIEKRPGEWVARFRGYMRPGRDKSQACVPSERLRAGHAKEDATAYAQECDQACRLLEVGRTVANIVRARDLKAITPAQADALLAHHAPPSSHRSALEALTVLDAARSHPSSARELTNDTAAAVRHERELGAFLAWAKIRLVAQVELAKVMERTPQVLVNLAVIPDVLGELTLDRRPAGLRTIALSYWPLDDLARAALLTTDARLRVAIGLGGFMGLRPSEVFESNIEDKTGDLLRTGKKNKQSERVLPLPSIVGEWIDECIGKRQSGLVLTSRSGRAHGCGAFNAASFAHWFRPTMVEAGVKDLPPKFLRKSFTSWAFRTTALPTQHVEAFLGHKTALAGIVTGRHYLADLAARELRPTAEAIDGIVRAALARARASLAAVAEAGTIPETEAADGQR